MAQYGYPPYTGFRSSYNYSNQPRVADYESFFNPIPLDFLQGQFDRRQGQYDTALAGALATKDELAQQQVGMADLAAKNQLIQQGIGDINKLVDEKYGGDWGKASKEVARSVTSLRANPFWNAQKEAQKQRDTAQELKIKYGPNAMIFNDPSNLSVIGENGQIRDFSQFQPDIVQKGNWGETVRKIFSSLTPDAYQKYGLTKAEVEGFLKTGEVKEISVEKLNRLANDPAVQQALLREHPEIARGFNEGSDAMREQFGLQGENVNDVARNIIAGNIAPAAFSQQDTQYLQDPLAIAARKKQLENTPQGVFGPVRETESIPTGYTPSGKDARKQLRWNFNMEGDLLPGAGKINQIEYNTVKSTVEQLRKENPDLTKGKSDYEVYEDYLNDPTGQKYKFSIDRVVPILREDVQQNVGRSLSGNINGTEWYLEDGSKVTNNWDDKKGIGSHVGIPSETMTQLLQNNEIPIGYNETRGSYYLEVPVIDGDIAKNADGSVNWSKTSTKGKKRVYFNPDTYTVGISNVVQAADQLLKSPKDRQELLKALPPTIVFDESRLNENEDVNNQEVFKMKNIDGEDEYYSLNEIRRFYRMQSEQYLHNAYGEQTYED